MNARKNQITENFPDTYEWVFDETTSKPWPSFNEWLKQGSGVYWIQGKAGSGKSTLMKFIIQNARTKEALEAESTLKDTVFLSFYFWLSGTPLQRNSHGLLSSLLHQLLEDHLSLTMQLLEKDVRLQRKVHVQDWAVQELSLLFQNVVRQQAESRTLCIFLDGLDEYERKADFRQLMDLIRDLSREKNVKICVSSRSEQHIRRELDKARFLRLQDLTEADIQKFVSSELEKACQHGGISVDVPAQEELVSLIVEKADGVFLWVRVALHDVLRGLTKHDTFDELLRRVDRLPADIEKLYEDMLQRLGEEWELCRQEAALYFKICILMDRFHFPAFQRSLLAYSVLSGRESLQDLSSSPRPDVDLHELLRQLERTDARITACCAGMLEIKGDEGNTKYEEVDEPSRQDTSNILQRVKLYSRRKVHISHRTVRDFLLEKPAGREILKCSPEVDSAIYYSIIDATIMALRERILSKLNGSQLTSLLWHIRAGRKLEPIVTSTRIYELLRSIEDTIRIIWAPPCKSSDEKGPQWEFDLFRENKAYGVDFMGRTLEYELPELFEHGFGRMLRKELHTGKTLNANYKNYLLLCASQWPAKNFEVLESLLKAGADPNATFYLPVSRPTKITPWITYCDSVSMRGHQHVSVSFLASGVNFLASGANLRELAVMVHGITGAYCRPSYFWGGVDHDDALIVTEHNARYLFQYSLDGAEDQHRLLLQHPSVIEVPSHQRVLLIRPKDEKQCARVVSAEDSASLLAMLKDTGIDKRKPAYPEARNRIIDKIQEYYDRLEKVDGYKFLEQLGYYKDPKDPAVPQGPFKRFEYLPDEPDAA